MTLVEFLTARLYEDEAAVRRIADCDYFHGVESDAEVEVLRFADPARVLAEVEAKRRIMEFHESWPVLVEQRPMLAPVDAGDLSGFVMRASSQIAWMTEKEYRRKFGDEPPTAPMLAALAAVYADHPDYDETWRP
jgi:hypothetical protein